MDEARAEEMISPNHRCLKQCNGTSEYILKSQYCTLNLKTSGFKTGNYNIILCYRCRLNIFSKNHFDINSF